MSETIYYHGVRTQEENSESTVALTGTAGLQVIIGTAPVNLATSGAAVNTPVLCQSMEEAKEKLGYSENFSSYTLCQAMYACFEMYNVAPVVFINVLDPEKHKKENAEKECGVVMGQVILPEDGILKDSITVKNEETPLVAGTDYLVTYNTDGKAVITLISESAKILENVKVKSTSIDPSVVQETDILGGHDAETGKDSGLEAIRQVYPRTGMAPALLLAPGWSHKKTIGAAMMEKCKEINGVFTAECILDLDTNAANKFSVCEEKKKEMGYDSEHAIVVWPKVETGGKNIFYSAVYGAMTAYTDANNDDVPSLSPSNRIINVDKAVLEDGTEIFMDRQQANVLNGAGMVTLLNEGGWKSWGNNTAAFPEITDMKDRWICCRRMFTWFSNSLIITYRERVDSPANYRLIESICDSENIRINSYVAAGKMAGGRIEYNEEENRVENILSGRVIFRIYMAAFTPAEDILFILKFDPSLLEEALSGGEVA